MSDTGKMSFKRTTKEQTSCYLSFVESHPEIQLHKNDPTQPHRMEELWKELAGQLNALKGPTRTPAKWKECLSHWKHQVRSRARKAKASKLVTGGGPCLEEVSDMEQRALQAFGTVVVDGISGVGTIGTVAELQYLVETVLKDEHSPVPPSTPSSSQKRKATSSDIADLFASQNSDQSPVPPSTPSSSQKRKATSSDIGDLFPMESSAHSLVPPSTPSSSRKRKATSSNMMGDVLKTMKMRHEEEKLFRSDSLTCMKNIGEQIKDAILTLAQAVAKNNL